MYAYKKLGVKPGEAAATYAEKMRHDLNAALKDGGTTRGAPAGASSTAIRD
jgi:hypothetical protein